MTVAPHKSLWRMLAAPESDASRILLAGCYDQLGRMDEERAAWNEALRISPMFKIEFLNQTLPYENPADLEKINSSLRKAALIN